MPDDDDDIVVIVESCTHEDLVFLHLELLFLKENMTSN